MKVMAVFILILTTGASLYGSTKEFVERWYLMP